MPPRTERTLRPLQEQAAGPRARRGRRGRAQVGAEGEEARSRLEEAALAGEQQDGRRATDGHPDERDEASEDDDDRGGSEMDIGVRGVGRDGRRRRGRWVFVGAGEEGAVHSRRATAERRREGCW